VVIDIILSEESYTAFVAAMADEGYSAIDRALSGIHAENATATRQVNSPHQLLCLVSDVPCDVILL
jgi:hypothetical protein